MLKNEKNASYESFLFLYNKKINKKSIIANYFHFNYSKIFNNYN